MDNYAVTIHLMGLSILEKAVYFLKLAGMNGDALKIATTELIQVFLRSKDIVYKSLEAEKLLVACSCKRKIDMLKEAINTAANNGGGRKLHRLEQDLKAMEDKARQCDCKGSYYLPNAGIKFLEVNNADKSKT